MLWIMPPYFYGSLSLSLCVDSQMYTFQSHFTYFLLHSVKLHSSAAPPALRKKQLTKPPCCSK